MSTWRPDEVPATAQRRKKHSVVKKPNVSLTADALSAAEYLVRELAKEKRPAHPARTSGAICLALEAEAARRGWKPPSSS